jgi:hypothetical protein
MEAAKSSSIHQAVESGRIKEASFIWQNPLQNVTACFMLIPLPTIAVVVDSTTMKAELHRLPKFQATKFV